MSKKQHTGKKAAKKAAKGKTKAKAKRATKATKRPKAGTVGLAHGKVSRAKDPRPDRHGPEGRKRVAERQRAARAKRTSKRVVVDPATRDALVAKERLRLASLEALLRDIFTRACAFLGVDPESLHGHDRPPPPTLATHVLGIYGLAAHSAGFQWSDFSNHRAPRVGLVKEIRPATHYSKMKPLIDTMREMLANPGKSPVLAAMRDAAYVLVAYATGKMRELEVKHGVRPSDPPTRRASFAARVGLAVDKAEAGAKVVAKSKRKAKVKRTKAAAKVQAKAARPRQRKPNTGRDFSEDAKGIRGGNEDVVYGDEAAGYPNDDTQMPLPLPHYEVAAETAQAGDEVVSTFEVATSAEDAL